MFTNIKAMLEQSTILANAIITLERIYLVLLVLAMADNFWMYQRGYY